MAENPPPPNPNPPNKKPRKTHRRAKGEGSIFYSPRTNRWHAKLAGRSRSASSKAEAAEKLKDLQAEKSQGFVSPDTTLNQWLALWLDRYRAGPATTYNNYETTLRCHVRPRLGHLLVCKLNAAHIEQWLRELDTGPRQKQNAYKLLSAALTAAEKRRLLPANPCRQVPCPKHAPAQINPFTVDELQSILAHFREHRLGAMFELDVRLGLRQGELFGLRWSKVDFQNQQLHVTHQNAESRGKVYYQPVKTRAGQRILHLNPQCIAALNSRRRLALAEGRAQPDDWVFPNPDGSPICRTEFTRFIWKPALRKLKIAHRGMHQLRHTVFTMMLNSKVSPKVVAEIAGHSKPSITLDIYARFTGVSGEAAIQSVSDQLAKRTTG